jgi:ketol-acid reductoisomerase
LEDRKDEHKSYRKRIDFYRRRIKKVKELISYIENNKEGINGIDAYKDIFEDCDLIIGSGGIENQVKNTIARRMKGQGKCWKNEGARAMVKILTSINNGWYSFEDYLNIFSLNRKPLELPKKLKEKIVISKVEKKLTRWNKFIKALFLVLHRHQVLPGI